MQVFDIVGEIQHAPVQADCRLPVVQFGQALLRSVEPGPRGPQFFFKPTALHAEILRQRHNLSHRLKFFQIQTPLSQERQRPAEPFQQVKLAPEFPAAFRELPQLVFRLRQGRALPLPFLAAEGDAAQAGLQFLVMAEGLGNGLVHAAGPKKLVGIGVKPGENGFQGGKARPGGEQGLPHLALLIENALPALDQGFVVDAVHAGEKILSQSLQERGEGVGGKRLILGIEEIVLVFLAAVETEFVAACATQAAADQELVVRVQKIVAGTQGKAEKKRLQGAHGAGFPGLVGTMHDMQAGQRRIKIQSAITERTKSLEFQALNDHDRSPPVWP
ncbi:MAG: hypothetical protein RBR18_14050 [Desulfovibrionaceae bacterium]|nr:hypothetical protein [Desulfovibrionaceae bacterium]